MSLPGGKGKAVDPENLALDVIAKVGPGGSFMKEDHTVKYMRTTALEPKIADREVRLGWEGKGRLDAQVRAKFAGLVAGDSTLPEGW